MSEIQRRSNLSLKEFNTEFVKTRTPVVITDAAHSWPAMKKWSVDWFHQNHGERNVHRRGDAESIQLKEHLDALETSTLEKPVRYLRNLNIQTDWPELLTDITPRVAITDPDWLSSKLMPTGWPRVARHLNQLFISGKGTTIPLHFDEWMMHAFITNIDGHKEFTMYAPEDAKYLYPKKDYYPVSEFPNPYEVDPIKYPLFCNAKAISIVVGPGESIFIPCGWWHTTRTHSTCISISSNFVNRHNWKLFREEMLYMRDQQGANRIKTKIIGVYLNVIGLIISISEFFRAPSKT